MSRLLWPEAGFFQAKSRLPSGQKPASFWPKPASFWPKPASFCQKPASSGQSRLLAKGGPTGLCPKYIVGPTALRALVYSRAYGPTGLINSIIRPYGPYKEAGFGRIKKPALARKEAGFGRKKKPALARRAGLRRLTPAPLAKRRAGFGRKSRLTPAKAGSFWPGKSRLQPARFPLGATEGAGFSRRKPAPFSARKEPAYTAKSRLLPGRLLAGFWPALARSSPWRPTVARVRHLTGRQAARSAPERCHFWPVSRRLEAPRAVLRETLSVAPKGNGKPAEAGFSGVFWESRLLLFEEAGLNLRVGPPESGKERESVLKAHFLDVF